MSAPENDPRWWKGLSPVAQRGVAIAASVLAGVLVAVMLHYLLYRIGLPSRPFIYVAF